MAFEDDGGAKKEKVLSHLSRRKEGSGFPQAWVWGVQAPSVAQQVTGSADVWGGGECLKNLEVLAGAPAMPGQPHSLRSASCRQRGGIRAHQALGHGRDGQSQKSLPVPEQKLSCLNRCSQRAHQNLTTNMETTTSYGLSTLQASELHIQGCNCLVTQLAKPK